MPHASGVNEAPPENTQAYEMLNYAQSLLGVPYRYGGSSPDSGFDCSGFVSHVFRQTLNIDLPHSSLDISRHGLTIERNELLPGDLVFFNTLRRKFSHVGIYLGDNHFIHSPSRGETVRIEDMSIYYWQKKYNGARRILQQPPLEQPVLDQFANEQATTE
jgi:cell wall-associated NlpC family hydrolase